MREGPVEVPAPGEGLAARAIARVPGGRRLSPLARVGVSVGVLALLVVAAALTEPWGFIGLGAAIGLLVVAGVPAARAGLSPLAALGRAAVPLTLPLFVFVAAGVVKSPREVQFAVGLVTLLGAWAGLIRPDAHLLRGFFSRGLARRSAGRLIVKIGVPSAIGLGALVWLTVSIAEVLGESEELTRTCFALAIYSLVFATVLRLIGYASTAFRALVTLSGLLALTRMAIEIGVLGGPDQLADTKPDGFLLALGAALALTVLVEILTSILSRAAGESTGLASDQLPGGLRLAVLLETPVASRRVTDGAMALGLLVALGSALFLLAAVFAASRAGGADESLDEASATRQPATPPAQLDDRELAEMFSPVLLFTEDQRWTPIPVDDYVRRASVVDWEGRRARIRTVADLDTDCPGVVKAPCYVLTQRCPGVKRGERKPDQEARCAEALPDKKAAYVRVARRSAWKDCLRGQECADGSPNPFAGARGRWADETEILLQYWYFYPFNEWIAPVAVGQLKQVHAADWEAVTIGLSGERALWVAYSSHCGGTYARWERVRVAESDPERLRPIVAVAHGSQANYRVARASRVPNFAECSGIPRDRLTLVSYAANIRDRTGDHTTWDPAPADLQLVSARTAPMSFPGRWAPYNRMVLENFRKDQRLGKDTLGPSGPPLQPLWQAPMRNIFLGGVWKEG